MEENVFQRFADASRNNRFPMSDELNILEFLFNKYKLTEIQDYSKETGENYNTIKRHVEKGMIPSAVLGKKVYIFKT